MRYIRQLDTGVDVFVTREVYIAHFYMFGVQHLARTTSFVRYRCIEEVRT